MGLERYVVDAVLIEKRSPTEIAKAHGVSRSWLYALIARVRGGGYEALEPHSRRPRSSPREVGEQVVATVLQLRQELVAAGHDAGPQTRCALLCRRCWGRRSRRGSCRLGRATAHQHQSADWTASG